MKRPGGLALVVLGLAAVAIGVAVIVLAAPATLHCTRTTQTCQLRQPGLLGGAHEVTLAIGSLHDSRVDYDTHRTGLTTRWLVTGPDGDLEIGAPTDSSAHALTYEQRARELARFLSSQDSRFDAELPGRNIHGWLVIALAGVLGLAGGIYLIRA